MSDIYSKYTELQTGFAKGDISFADYTRDIIKWGSDFGDILKARSDFQNSGDQSHGGKLVKKKIVDKKGHEVTKWVNPNSEEGSQRGSKKGGDSKNFSNKPKIDEFSRSLEDWEKALSSADTEALKKASKYAERPEIRKMARNEVFKRSHNLNRYIDLSFVPDFMLDDYVSRYNREPLKKPGLEAINTYRDNGYVGINKSLRGEKVDLTDGQKSAIKNIDNLIDNSELLNDVTLYRGLSGKNALLYINYLKSLEVGDVFEEEGFSSTSLTKNQASKFSELYNSTQNITLKIFASKGKKALCMQNLGDETNQEMYKDEYEFLLPRRQKFQIVESKGDEISVVLV